MQETLIPNSTQCNRCDFSPKRALFHIVSCHARYKIEKSSAFNSIVDKKYKGNYTESREKCTAFKPQSRAQAAMNFPQQSDMLFSLSTQYDQQSFY